MSSIRSTGPRTKRSHLRRSRKREAPHGGRFDSLPMRTSDRLRLSSRMMPADGPGPVAGSVPPPDRPRSPLPLGMPHVPLARTSARTPDPGPGWSNLHIFMQTCGVQRGTVRLARTRRACPSPYWHALAARGPKPLRWVAGRPFPGRSGVEGLPGEGSGPAGPPGNLRPAPHPTRHHRSWFLSRRRPGNGALCIVFLREGGGNAARAVFWPVGFLHGSALRRRMLATQMWARAL
jgi:hypothetical protein